MPRPSYDFILSDSYGLSGYTSFAYFTFNGRNDSNITLNASGSSINLGTKINDRGVEVEHILQNEFVVEPDGNKISISDYILDSNHLNIIGTGFSDYIDVSNLSIGLDFRMMTDGW